MRLRVSSLTVGLPRKARDTVDCETPARYATSIDVALAIMRSIMSRDGPHRQFSYVAGRSGPAIERIWSAIPRPTRARSRRFGSAPRFLGRKQKPELLRAVVRAGGARSLLLPLHGASST